MGIPILNELNQETDRLFIAGSRFAKGDVRIKKYIAPLAKMGEKAPVFLKMSELLAELIEDSRSAKELIEVKSLLLAVMNTQGDAGDIGELIPLDNNTDICETSASYSELAPLLETLRKSGSNRLELVKEAYKNGIFNDPRTIKAAVDALGDGNHELVDYLINTVIPSMNAAGYLYKCFDAEGKAADANKLRAIYKLRGKDALPLAEKCVGAGSDQVKTAAIDILSNHREYEDLLISLLSEKKAVREAAVNGLARMDTKKGIGSLLELFNSKIGAKLVQGALAANRGSHLTQSLASVAEERYKSAKKDLDDKEAITRLYAVFDALHHKKDESIAGLMKTVLTERALDGINETMSKEELTSLGNIYDKSLAILYQTSCGNDFIWDMFMKSRQGLMDKLMKKKAKATEDSLAMYAFYIGIDKLDAEQYYNTFFKTDLYNNINKLNRNAFASILRYAEENKKPLSAKLANYFIGRNEFANALKVVSVKDKQSVSAILRFFDENMSKNVYSRVNYEILLFAGENRLPEFNGMYETYCDKKHVYGKENEVLRQYYPGN